ncbi:MAG: Ycf66 family protein [Scytolyngbya sp. HA4215-MV1]|nr:Ycf66 family protein [Scytolyngbya sp. HA4215-MV1]
MGIPLSWSSFLGIVLAVAGAGLYALRSLRPSLARDQDIFFSAVALLCGGIIFFQGWRQDPILQFSQFLLTGCAIWFAYESIRLRSVATEQARRSTPIVDEDRPVSRVYRAELDELSPAEDRPTRRIRGTRDSRPSRSDDYYDDTPRRRPSSRNSSSNSDERYGSDDRPRKRRPRPTEERPVRTVDDAESTDYSSDYPEDRPPRRSSSRPSNGQEPGAAPKPKRSPRPLGDEAPPPRRRRDEDPEAEPPSPSDYVDYKPVDPGDDETDNWGDY